MCIYSFNLVDCIVELQCFLLLFSVMVVIMILFSDVWEFVLLSVKVFCGLVSSQLDTGIFMCAFSIQSSHAGIFLLQWGDWWTLRHLLGWCSTFTIFLLNRVILESNLSWGLIALLIIKVISSMVQLVLFVVLYLRLCMQHRVNLWDKTDQFWDLGVIYLNCLINPILLLLEAL